MNVFLDTNIILRQLTKDNSLLYKKANAIFIKIANKEANGFISTLVLHEVIYVLEHVYKVDRKIIVKNIKKLISISNIYLVDFAKSIALNSLTDYKVTRVDFADCLYKQICLANNYQIVSFDKHFDALKIKRLEKI